VALLKGVFLAPGADISELIARVEALAGGSMPPPPAGPRSGGGPGRAVAPPASASRIATAPTPAIPAATPTPTATPAPTAAPIATPAPTATPTPTIDPAAPVADRWRALVDEVEKVTPLAAPSLKQATLLWLREGEVAIQLPAGMMATAVERRKAEIEAVFARCLGSPTLLTLKLGAAPAAGAVPGEAAPVSIAATEAAEKLARSVRVKDAARTHPNVKEAARILDGSLTIEEL
jgi:DNA polymerase-3 subunit gamma/tau